MEGAVSSAARSVVIDSRIGTGKDTGAWVGSTKAAVDAESALLLAGRPHTARYVEATSAALAGLAIP